MVNEWGFAWLAEQVKPEGQPTRLDLVSDEGKWLFWLYLEPDGPLTLARAHAAWAEDRTLELTLQHSAETRLDLGALAVGTPTAAQHDGASVPVPPVTEGIVTLPPSGSEARWQLTFG
jgi:hypothetical protein